MTYDHRCHHLLCKTLYFYNSLVSIEVEPSFCMRWNRSEFTRSKGRHHLSAKFCYSKTPAPNTLLESKISAISEKCQGRFVRETDSSLNACIIFVIIIIAMIFHIVRSATFSFLENVYPSCTN